MKQGAINSNWNNLVSSSNVTGIGFGFPLENYTEEMDISHIFYFKTAEQAEAFGIQAVQFDNNPGIDLSKEYYGGKSAPTVDIGLDFTNERDLTPKGTTAAGSYTVTENWINGVNAINNTKLLFKRHSYKNSPLALDLWYGQIQETNAGRDVSALMNFVQDEARPDGYPLWRVRYCVIVYHGGSRLGSDNKIQLGLNRLDDNFSAEYTLPTGEQKCNYVVVDLLSGANATAGHSYNAGIHYVSIKWPGLTSGQWFNLTHVAFFDNAEDAETFGKAAADFGNEPGTYVSGGRGWNMGNNRAYGLLRGSNGGSFTTDSSLVDRGGSTVSLGSANAYLSPNIGFNYNATAADRNGIYHISMFQMDNPTFRTDNLQFDGYQLLSTVLTGDSLATMGMLEPSLSADGIPVYRQETVEYLAILLSNSLVIPEVNKREYFVANGGNDDYNSIIAGYANNYYNYNYVSGTPSMAYADADGNPRDLAQALRDCIDKIDRSKELDDRDVGYAYFYKIMYRLGSYEETMAKANAGKLTGSFKDVEPYIDTCYDAAYYLLNNIFVPGSYNTPKADYNYLVLQPAIIQNASGKTVNAYIFDAGFTDGTSVDAASGVKYDPVTKTITNSVTGSNTLGKTMYEFSGTNQTTFYPFLPITDQNNSTGMTMSPYFQDSGASCTDNAGQYYANRDFNYVLASNGEFVYREEDDLFFEFQGDDDVYLFINGQLVMDIGGAHSITSVNVNINDYVLAARQNVANGSTSERDLALAMEDGGTYKFDFYYMERHGYGANMRIVTNIRVTDPSVSTVKSAWQNGELIDYGGVVDRTQPIEYGFTMTNTGNNRLFNLTFEDKDIGVKLDPENGLTITGDNVYDKNGASLDVTDLVAYVDGFHDWDSENPQNPTETLVIRFANNEALKAFLRNLSAESTSTDQGGGLWQHSTVSIRGIGYILTPDQADAGVFNNTVHVTATSLASGSGENSKTLHSQANHRVYISGQPFYYQWAKHNLYLPMSAIFEDARDAAGNAGNQHYEFQDFLLNPPANYVYAQCDKYGTVIEDTAEVKKYHDGYLVNYQNPGTYGFNILASKVETTSASGLEKGDYAIIRVTIHVTDVQNSYFVLDYGLTTENLDTNGELFKNDELFGASNSNDAKMMGISTTQPSYLDYTTNQSDYNRINFDAVSNNDIVNVADGKYAMNIENGKDITFNSYTGNYSLSGVGTVRVTVHTPTTWTDPHLYFWYDGGVNNTWPGTKMEKIVPGEFYADIPGDVAHVIVNNGTDQTIDLSIDVGKDNTIDIPGDTVTIRNSDGTEVQRYQAKVRRHDITVTATMPEDWGEVYLYCWNYESTETLSSWPGTMMSVNADGTYSLNIPGDYNRMIINNGNGNGRQTYDLIVTPGSDLHITPKWDMLDTTQSINFYKATIALQTTYTIKIAVPDGWTTPHLYSWNAYSVSPVEWPGKPLTAKNSDGLYEIEVPVDTAYIIVNNGQGGVQTSNIGIKPGVEAMVTVVDNQTVKVDYNDGFTFTPSEFMNENNSIYMAITVHNNSTETEAIPTPLNQTIDPSKEVQMYKQITVLPANVVYYEDDFPAIRYENTAGEGKIENTFIAIGSSEDLTQSVNPDQVYGQDDAYSSNSDMSGNSLHVIAINNSNVTAAFDFTGTGFELIGRTDADDTASLTVEVWSGNTIVKRIPVVTRFDNNEDGNSAGGDEQIHQVPVIRVNDLPHGQYTVKIKGVRGCYCTEMCSETVKNPDCLMCKYAPSSCDPTVKHLYLDGIRVFLPMGETNEHYHQTENGAAFHEIRDLITTGKGAVAQYDGNSMSVSAGTITWTENLGVDDSILSAFNGNQVTSIDDYLLRGPNNEVYVNGTVANAALVITVRKSDNAAASTLQFAVRAVDEAQFYIGSTAAPADPISGMNAYIEFYARQSDGTYAWEPLVTVTSATEQYYSVDLSRCYSVDGNILAAVRVASGMASFTSLKTNNLTIVATTGATASTLYYINGELARCSCDMLCSEDSVNRNCPLCRSDYTLCNVSQESGTIEEVITDGAIPLSYLSLMMRSASISDSVDSEMIPDEDSIPDGGTEPAPEPQPDTGSDQHPDSEVSSQPGFDTGTPPETDQDAPQQPNAEPDTPSNAPSHDVKPDTSMTAASNVSAFRDRVSVLWSKARDAFASYRKIFQ